MLIASRDTGRLEAFPRDARRFCHAGQIHLFPCCNRTALLLPSGVTPYQPNMNSLAGTYRIEVGPAFYLGSTTALGSRVSQHRADLEAGTHPNATLQAAYDKHGTFAAYLLKEVPRKRDDTDKDHRKRLQFHEQALLDALFFKKNCANTSQNSGFNSTLSDTMKARWQDPEYRETRLRSLRAARIDNPREVSPETRERLAAAKQGARNPNARPCTLSLAGETFHFDTGAEAAAHFGTTQQAMDAWLKGHSPWPGTGARKPRPQNAHLVGLTGGYNDLLTCGNDTGTRNNSGNTVSRATKYQVVTLK